MRIEERGCAWGFNVTEHDDGWHWRAWKDSRSWSGVAESEDRARADALTNLNRYQSDQEEWEAT